MCALHEVAVANQGPSRARSTPSAGPRWGVKPDDSGPLPQFALELSDADATLEWRGEGRPAVHVGRGRAVAAQGKPAIHVVDGASRASRPTPRATPAAKRMAHRTVDPQVLTDVTLELVDDDSLAPVASPVPSAPKSTRSAPEVVTDVSLELLPDESVGVRPLPSLVAQAIARAHTLAPVTIHEAAPAQLSPDASLEFPHPVNVEAFDDGDAEAEDEELVASGVPRPSRWKAIGLAAACAGFAILVGVAMASRPSLPVEAETATAITPPHVSLPDPAPLAKKPVAAPAIAETTEPAKPVSKIGTIVTPSWAKGRRVFVDGTVAGSSPKLDVACGTHFVKVGTAGKTRTVIVPCGGEVSVSP